MFQTALPESLTRAPWSFSLEETKDQFLQHWTRLAKERFLIGLLKCFDEYPALRSIKFYVDDGNDLIEGLKPRSGRYQLSIDCWEWDNEPDPPVLITEVEAQLSALFADELADFMREPFDRESVGAALAALARL